MKFGFFCCYYFIALSCVPTSRSFDRMEQLCSYRAGLNHVYLRLFRKAVEKIKVFFFLNPTVIMGTLVQELLYIFLRMGNIPKKIFEKMKIIVVY